MQNFLSDVTVQAFGVEWFMMQNWQFYLELLLRIAIALFCGVIIGLERTKRFKEAGVRTHAVVAVASAVLMIVSKYAFADVTLGGLTEGKGYDPSRLASQVITGISFLGAGMIFKNGNFIKGLTTAAGIWATCAIGLAIGGGMYVIGIILTVALLAVQFIMHKIRVGYDTLAHYNVTFKAYNSEEFRKALKAKLVEWKAVVEEESEERRAEGITKYVYVIRMDKAINEEDQREFFQSRSDVVFFSIKKLS